jgi:hypothetical protein
MGSQRNLGVVCLDGKAPGRLASNASFVRHLTAGRLASAQFAEFVAFGKKGKTVKRPVEWN